MRHRLTLLAAALVTAAIGMAQTAPHAESVPAKMPSAPAASAAPTPPAAADYSTPKDAAKSYLRAIDANDAKALRNALTFPTDCEDQVKAMTAIMIKTGDLQKAAAERFGIDGEKQFGTHSKEVLEARLHNVDKGAVEVTGESAVLTLPEDKAAGQPGGVTHLKKVDGNWKIDAEATFRLTDNPADKAAQRVSLAKRLADVTDNAIADITKGKYFSAQEAYTDYTLKCAAEARAVYPTSAPATEPTAAASKTP